MKKFIIKGYKPASKSFRWSIQTPDLQMHGLVTETERRLNVLMHHLNINPDKTVIFKITTYKPHRYDKVLRLKKTNGYYFFIYKDGSSSVPLCKDAMRVMFGIDAPETLYIQISQ